MTMNKIKSLLAVIIVITVFSGLTFYQISNIHKCWEKDMDAVQVVGKVYQYKCVERNNEE